MTMGGMPPLVPRSYRKRLAEYARMSPLEVWYARIDSEDYLGLVTNPSRKKQELKAIAKATETSGSELDYPRLASMVDALSLIFHPEQAQAADFTVVSESNESKLRSRCCTKFLCIKS
jgi:hypothetical protein